MWVTCLQENLAKGLATVGRAVASRSTLPVTQNVLIQTDQGRLKLTATNLEIAISTWIGGQIESEGAITIPARMLADFVNSLPPEKVEIALVNEPRGIHITCANFEATINGTDAAEFPPIPSVDDGASITIPGDTLRGALERVVFSAATDDSRPALTGVNMDITETSLTLAAADGFRMSVEKSELANGPADEISCIVPARTMSELQRLLTDPSGEVELAITAARTQALFRMANVEVVTQLVQGTFPDYEKIMPVSHTTKADIDLQRMVQATRAASVFARDGSGIIRLIMSPGENGDGGSVAISSRAEEMGDNKGIVEAKVEGDESKIAFNARFLTDVLSVMRGDDVVIETTTASSPGLFRSDKLTGYSHVIMPMYVQW
jgi:DNA polymerase-3 subunit beta